MGQRQHRRRGASLNQVDGNKLAEAEVKKLGGDGWTLLEQSNVPGFGAAKCTHGNGKVRF